MKERLLRIFVEEVIKQKEDYNAVKDFKRGTKNIMDFLNYFDDIDKSLYWAETTQGHSFWCKVNDKSKLFLRKYLGYAY